MKPLLISKDKTSLQLQGLNGDNQLISQEQKNTRKFSQNCFKQWKNIDYQNNDRRVTKHLKYQKHRILARKYKRLKIQSLRNYEMSLELTI